jgi:hypothetical protein
MRALSTKESSNLVGFGATEVDRAAPRGVVGVDKIRAELAGVVPHWTEVVVDHIEQHREALLMGGVDEPLEGIGASVALVHSE